MITPVSIEDDGTVLIRLSKDDARQLAIQLRADISTRRVPTTVRYIADMLDRVLARVPRRGPTHIENGQPVYDQFSHDRTRKGSTTQSSITQRNEVADKRYCSQCDHDLHLCKGCGVPIAHDEPACDGCTTQSNVWAEDLRPTDG